MYKSIFMSMLLLVSACDKAPVGSSAEQGTMVVRHADAKQLQRGAEIFRQNCARCHGDAAQGDANWRSRDAQGRFPPPPLNGTAHSWHHPLALLRAVIADGSPGGQGNMPAWRDKLSEQEIDDVIAWFQNQWPDEVYTAWYEINQRAGQ